MNCMNCGTPLTAGVKFCPRCGTPAPQPEPYAQPYTPPGGQMYSSFDGGAQHVAPPRRKSRAGKILLVIFGVLLLLGVGVVAAVYYGYRYVEGRLRNSEPYQLAVQELKRDPVAAEHFGEIRETGFPLGAFNEDAGGSGHAEFSMSVEGTKGSGRYSVAMSRTGGVWSITHALLNTPDGQFVNLMDGPVGSGSGEASGGADEPPPPPPLPPRPRSARAGTTVSGGVLDGKATSKPAPAYPALAKAARAGGTVVVQVTVDEQGRVREAEAVSGHPLLRPAAVQAARQARLTPTLLSGKPVEVKGVLTYNFQPE